MVAWLLTYAAHSSLLLCAAALLDHQVRSDPASRSLLWRTAAIAGVVTASIAWVGSAPGHVTLTGGKAGGGAPALWIEAEHGSLERGRVDPPAVIDARRIETRRIEATFVSVDTCSDVGAPRAAVPPAVERLRSACSLHRSKAVWAPPILWLWLLGIAFLSVRLGAELIGRRRVVRGLSPAGPRVCRVFGTLPGSPASATLWTSGEVAAPCVVGSRIVLPRWCEEEMSDAELRGVLGHEFAHVLRRDPAWSLLFRGLVTVFWFQPLNRWAWARVRDASELACDDWTVEHTGDGYGLAASIARVAEALTPLRWVSDVSMLGAGRLPLEERVLRILKPSPVRARPPWLIPVLAALVVTPAWLLPTVGPFGRVATVVAVERVLHVDSVGFDDEALLGRSELIVFRRAERG